jgi:chorismate synthase
MPRLSTFFLVTVLGGAALVGAFRPSTAQADDACTTKAFKFKQVEQACKSGGRAAAKDLMKAAVKKAKASGEDINCKSCHQDLKTYELKDNAAKDLKRWI